MTDARPPRVPLSQRIYLLVFGIFFFVYLWRVLNGTAITADWVIFGVATFLLLITAYRILIMLGRRGD